MKIAYLITRADLGGAQVHLLDLIDALRRQYEIHLITGESGYLTNAAQQMGVVCHVLRHLVHPIEPLRDLRALAELCSLLQKEKPDILHAHTSKAGLVGRLAAKLTGCPAVFTAHTWCFAEGTSWKWRTIGLPAERLAARAGSVTINVSEANRTLALRHRVGVPERQLTIHNGIPDVPWRANPSEGTPPVIAVVARFAVQKDQALLLEALASIGTDFCVQFIGDGPTRIAVERKALDLGLQERVQFLGNRNDIPQLLAKANIFVLPTRWEGFPLSVLEAMRAGLPVIASAVGGVEEAVIDGETGFLVPPHESEKLASALRLLLKDVRLRACMGALGRGRYESNFEISVMIERTLAAYQTVLKRSKRHRKSLPVTIQPQN